MNFILASASARRQELLGRVIGKFSVTASSFDENSVEFNGNCERYVMELAKGKVADVALNIEGEVIILGCDTVVFSDNKVLGKPKDKEEAAQMLSLLSGKTHQVYTGVVIFSSKTGTYIEKAVKTDVKFSTMTEAEIDCYVESGEPMDKAGAYGIQGVGGVFIEEICGCYYNVVGLPLNKLKTMLKDIGMTIDFDKRSLYEG